MMPWVPASQRWLILEEDHFESGLRIPQVDWKSMDHLPVQQEMYWTSPPEPSY